MLNKYTKRYQVDVAELKEAEKEVRKLKALLGKHLRMHERRLDGEDSAAFHRAMGVLVEKSRTALK